jgi:pimeloyl-ACP methyl ester carboxylesterase
MTRDLGAELAKAEDVSFAAADGVPLKGWLLHGRPSRAALILCHDLGESKAELINLAIALNHEGFTVLAFDFRGHGESGGTSSTLGIEEARDVTGAVDYIAAMPKDRLDAHAIGIFGAGMGAHAAVLAAADRPVQRVLVLDGLWPDVRWKLVRGVLPDWPWGQDHVGGVSVAMFALLSGNAPGRRRAADILPELAGRDLLLVAPAGDGRLDDAMKAMYATLPERRDSERNLITLPATRASGLSADDLARYHRRVVLFFDSRLPAR